MSRIGQVLETIWGTRSKRRTAEGVAEALNARRYEALAGFVTDDLVYLDTMSNAIHGKEAFVAANLRMHMKAPDLKIVLESFSESSGALLISGRTTSANPDYCAETLWHAKFARGKMCELQAFRDQNAVSLPIIGGAGEA